jgi:hypothetical protein
MTSQTRLAGVEAKPGRADVHLAELDRATDAFLAKEDYMLVAERGVDPETGYEERVIPIFNRRRQEAVARTGDNA